jgi:mono/diheme cytochrome c family protein
MCRISTRRIPRRHQAPPRPLGERWGEGLAMGDIGLPSPQRSPNGRGSLGFGRLASLACLLLALTGFRQHMADQPYYRPLDPSDFFPDGMSARSLPPDTVPRGTVRGDTSRDQNGVTIEQFPYPIDRALLERGQGRFNIYCAPCHGESGYGDGTIVQRGFSPPPSYHTDRLRQAPVGYLFGVVTNGLGSMPSYAAQVPVPDRWAIIAYIRALQLSQNAAFNDLPADAQATLGGQQ